MPRPSSEHPTELELTILKVLWQESPKSVQQVRDELAIGEGGRELTVSSVMTMMNIMVRKGYVKRKKQGRAFLFEPVVSEQWVNRGMLGDLVDRVFDGSAKAVMLELLETSNIDLEDIADIRRMINRKAKEQS